MPSNMGERSDRAALAWEVPGSGATSSPCASLGAVRPVRPEVERRPKEREGSEANAGRHKTKGFPTTGHRLLEDPRPDLIGRSRLGKAGRPVAEEGNGGVHHHQHHRSAMTLKRRTEYTSASFAATPSSVGLWQAPNSALTTSGRWPATRCRRRASSRRCAPGRHRPRRRRHRTAWRWETCRRRVASVSRAAGAACPCRPPPATMPGCTRGWDGGSAVAEQS